MKRKQSGQPKRVANRAPRSIEDFIAMSERAQDTGLARLTS